MTDVQDPVPGDVPEVVPEVRTRCLVIVDETGVERAAIEATDDVIELRLGGSRAGMPCEVVAYAGEDEPGQFAAGVELWANGESVGGSVVTVAGSQVSFHRLGTRPSTV